MRIVGSRKQYRIAARPTGGALKAAAALRDVALALAAVPTTGVPAGVYRFATHAEANAHAEAAQARAIAANLRARQSRG